MINKYEIIIIIICAASFATPIMADSYWQVSNGNWGNDLNWDPASEPGCSTYTYINNSGTAEITEDGETCFHLYLGYSSSDIGNVYMTGGSLTAEACTPSNTGKETIGRYGEGTFTQTAGINSIGYGLTLGSSLGSSGTYELSGTGQLSINRLGWVGYHGTGEFIQSEQSTATIGQVLYIASEADSKGTYELSDDAQLTVYNDEYIGYRGTGAFTQTGGIHSVIDYFILGHESSGDGSYDLSGTGQLTAKYEEVGKSGTAVFKHSDGTNNFDVTLKLAVDSNSEGTYNLSGAGQLTSTTGSELIGIRGLGTFIQTGGTNNTYQICLGNYSGSNGTYTISGGDINVENFTVASYDGSIGTFNITHPDANVTVYNQLKIRSGSIFTAVPESKIYMTGSNFINQSIDPNKVMGLSNLEFIFQSSSEDIDFFEVAGEDIGATYLGFNKNFALRTLRVGDVNTGKIRLIDSDDNQPNSTEAEALYVTNLILGADSSLDLNGLNLYYSYFTDMGGIIITNGGNLIQVTSFAPGDFNENNQVDFLDFAIFGNAWRSQPGDDNWNDRCNISETADNVINELDLTVFCENWFDWTIP